MGDVNVNETEQSEFADLDGNELGLSAELMKELGIGEKSKSKKAPEKKDAKKDKPKKDSDAVDKSNEVQSIEKLFDIETKIESTEKKADEADVDESEDDEVDENEADEAEESEENEQEDSDDMIELIHNNEKVALSLDDVKSYAQKGFDYTKKTQALAEERKNFEAEAKETRAELEQAYKELEKASNSDVEQQKLLNYWNMAIDEMSIDRPDLLQEIAPYFNKVKKSAENPIFDKTVNSLRNEINELKKGIQVKGHEEKLSSFSAEKQSIEKSEIGKTMESLGIVPDWDLVKGEWAQSGKPLKNVLYSIYGDDIRALMSSKQKLAKAKKLSGVMNSAKTVAGKKVSANKGVDISRMTPTQIINAYQSGKLSLDNF